MASLFVPVYATTEEDSDGVTATVNGESFNKGDAVTISGSVGEEGSGSNSLFARVYDPDSIELDIERVHINADGTFRHGIATDAGPLEGGLNNPMTKSGTYTVTFEYFGDSGIETGEVTFEYNAVESASTTAAPTETTTTPSPTIPSTTSQTLNATALRGLVAQGQEQFQQLSTTLTQGGNVSDGILANLNSIQSTFQEIQRQLNGVAEGTQVIQ